MRHTLNGTGMARDVPGIGGEYPHDCPLTRPGAIETAEDLKLPISTPFSSLELASPNTTGTKTDAHSILCSLKAPM
jgi:hypothetical protein